MSEQPTRPTPRAPRRQPAAGPPATTGAPADAHVREETPVPNDTHPQERYGGAAPADTPVAGRTGRLAR